MGFWLLYHSPLYRKKAEALPDMKTAKAAQPMLSGVSETAVLPKRRTSKIVAQGVGRLPYPFRRRTATVVHFEPANTRQSVPL